MTEEISSIVDQVFPDKDSNEHLKKMFKIIEFRRQNPLIHLPLKDRDGTYVVSYRHHIVPKAWFKLHKQPIDNTKANIIRLTILEHLEVHILLKNYFRSIGDENLACKMALAISEICSMDISRALATNEISELDSSLMAETEKNASDSIIAHSKVAKAHWEALTEDQHKEHGNKVSQALLNMPEDRKRIYCENLSKHTSQRWASLSEEKRQEWIDHATEARNKTKASWSEEKKKEVSANQSKGLKAFWKSASMEFREQYAAVQSKSQKRHWESLSEEERQAKIAKSASGLQRHWKEASEEYHENYRRIHRDIWVNMSSEEKIEHSRKTKIGTRNAFAAMTKDEYEAMCQKHAEAGKLRRGSVHVYKENPRDHKFVYPDEAKNLVENFGFKYGNPSRRWKKEDEMKQCSEIQTCSIIDTENKPRKDNANE